MAGVGGAGKAEWVKLVELMADLVDALIKSTSIWRDFIARHDMEILEMLSDPKRLRSAIEGAPDEAKAALLEARLSLEEIVSVLAGEPEKLFEEEEYERLVESLRRTRERLARLMAQSGE